MNSSLAKNIPVVLFDYKIKIKTPFCDCLQEPIGIHKVWPCQPLTLSSSKHPHLQLQPPWPSFGPQNMASQFLSQDIYTCYFFCFEQSFLEHFHCYFIIQFVLKNTPSKKVLTPLPSLQHSSRHQFSLVIPYLMVL